MLVDQEVVHNNSPFDEQEGPLETLFRVDVDAQFSQTLKPSLQNAKSVFDGDSRPAYCQIEPFLLVRQFSPTLPFDNWYNVLCDGICRIRQDVLALREEVLRQLSKLSKKPNLSSTTTSNESYCIECILATHIRGGHDLLIICTADPAQVQIPDLLVLVHDCHTVQTILRLIADIVVPVYRRPSPQVDERPVNETDALGEWRAVANCPGDLHTFLRIRPLDVLCRQALQRGQDSKRK